MGQISAQGGGSPDLDLDRLQQVQIQKNLSLPPVKERLIAKHTSRACLECRNRHSKCDGRLPICTKCAKRNKVCVYVESKRGGSRKKGVSKKSRDASTSPDDQIMHHNDSAKESSNEKNDNKGKSSDPFTINSLSELTAANLKVDMELKGSKESHKISRNFQPKRKQVKLSNGKGLQLPCFSREDGEPGCDNVGCLAVETAIERHDLDLPCIIRDSKTNHPASVRFPGFKEIKIRDNAIANGTKSEFGDVQIHSLHRRYPDLDERDEGNTNTIENELGAGDVHPSLALPTVLDNDHLVDVKEINSDEVINKYYTYYHRAHPFMPPQNELVYYLNAGDAAFNQYMLVMNIISEGLTSNHFALDINLVTDRIVQCYKSVINDGYRDLITLQTLILVSLAAHVSGLHKVSKSARLGCMDIIQDLHINSLDSIKWDEQLSQNMTANNSSKALMTPNSSVASVSSASSPRYEQAGFPASQSKEGGHNLRHRQGIFKSTRCQDIPAQALLDNARRCFWEYYFMDVIIGSADGRTLSKLASLKIDIRYPSVPAREIFDYKTRAEAVELVNNAVRKNINMTAHKPFTSILTQLNASLENMDMRFQDPKRFNAPYLINAKGFVNEGVHQSMIMFNYAYIFAHRPFSFLWKTEVPEIPKCCDEATFQQSIAANEVVIPDKVEARKLIETRKTISAADAIITLLIDTDASKINNRTPLFACSLALQSLVHMSAFVWVDSLIKTSCKGRSDEDTNALGFSSSDLEVYAEYVKLSLNAISKISEHWILSGKLVKHIKDTAKQIPGLYAKLKNTPVFEETNRTGRGIIFIRQDTSSSTKNSTRNQQSGVLYSNWQGLDRGNGVSSGNTYTDGGETSPSFKSAEASSPNQIGTLDEAVRNENLNFNGTNTSISDVNNNFSWQNFMDNNPEFGSGNSENNSAGFAPTLTQITLMDSGNNNSNFSNMNNIHASDESLSPVSETGCNWIDKMLGDSNDDFDFEELYNSLKV